MARYHYTPQQSGWIGVEDRWRKRLASIDCTQGGAQEAFEELCHDLARAGWELEKRTFDWRFVRRGNDRWEIRIGVLPPGVEPRGPYGWAARPWT